MEILKLIYVRSHSIGGLLIRAAQWWAPYTHVGILTDHGTVINARAFHGVVEEELDQFMDRYSKHEIVEVEVTSHAAALFFARAQVGMKYDYGSIFRFISRLFGQEHPSRWQCVELAETTVMYAGRRRFRAPLSQVTVQQSYMVN